MRIVSNSPEQTRRIGEILGRSLDRGIVVALIGELGSGKTVFAQGLARGLDVDPDEYVSSPSFTLVNHYRGRVPIFHVDTYRLADAAEMVSLGYEEYFEPDGVTIIEWADKVHDLLPERFVLAEFTLINENTREIDIGFPGPWPRDKESELASAFGDIAR